MSSLWDFRRILDDIDYPEYTFHLNQYGQNRDYYLVATYMEKDIATGKDSVQTTRKWRVSPHMVKSELVQTALKCILTSMEHRAREHFTYRGRRIFGPHYNVDALWELAGKRSSLDFRDEG